MPQQSWGRASRIEDGSDICAFRIERVSLGVAASSPPASIHQVAGKAIRQQVCDLKPFVTHTQAFMHEDDAGSGTKFQKADPRTVYRTNGTFHWHDLPPLRPHRSAIDLELLACQSFPSHLSTVPAYHSDPGPQLR